VERTEVKGEYWDKGERAAALTETATIACSDGDFFHQERNPHQHRGREGNRISATNLVK